MEFQAFINSIYISNLKHAHFQAYYFFQDK